MNNIVVLGSMNMDMVLDVEQYPKEGETILARSMEKIPGGKGANQAVAASRLGSNVFMIAKIGMDENGEILLANLKKDNINIENVYIDKVNPTGNAIITINKSGNNSIIVVSGSNMKITSKDLDKAKKVIDSDKDIMVSQFETPIDITVKAFKLAKEKNIITILNPAPAHKVPKELLENVDIIVPNETEFLKITGVEINNTQDARVGCENLFNKGVKYVIVTLGEKGSMILSKQKEELIPAKKVKAIDTTAAGDSFIGALASKIDAKNLNFDNLKSAVEFSSEVSSIVVTKKGAQFSIPYLKDIK
ncbi:ribokinase [Clostridium oceanicum]|uniref:Ribokinase n=1 Tax=Clostridium oceanicum TaxID=1543 RepID=A0ABP3UUP5_9CLOT